MTTMKQKTPFTGWISFGRWLKAARQLLELEQHAAARLGQRRKRKGEGRIDQSMWSRYEADQHKPSLQQVHRFTRILQLPCVMVIDPKRGVMCQPPTLDPAMDANDEP